MENREKIEGNRVRYIAPDMKSANLEVFVLISMKILMANLKRDLVNFSSPIDLNICETSSCIIKVSKYNTKLLLF